MVVSIISAAPTRKRTAVTSSRVCNYVELVGPSTTGSDGAIRNAIETASKTLRHLAWFEVKETRGRLADGKVAHWQVTLQVALRLEP